MKNKICNISLFSSVLACVAGGSDVAVGATGWSDARAQQSYAGAYNQVAEIRDQQAYIEAQSVPVVQTASATQTLPLEVEDKKLADKILNNEPGAPSISDLDRCSMINIRGKFKWGIPESGLRKSMTPQCMAVVNLVDVNSNAVLATTTVAAGDSIKCNIDEFPESGYSVELEKVELPADEAPTMKDVEKVLNKEQKQNAGFKIAAAAIIGGLAGNMLGPKQNGDEKLLGTGKQQLGTTALGAVSAAGIMAASSFSGKVAGDTIKSTAINATAGMMAGNMAAGMMGSNSVMATTKCTVKGVEKDCVIGRYSIGGETDYEKIKTKANCTELWTNSSGGEIRCLKPTVTDTSKYTFERFPGVLLNIKLEGLETASVFLDSYTSDNWSSLSSAEKGQCYDENAQVMAKCVNNDNNVFYKISNAIESTGSNPGYAVFDSLPHKTFGYKISDWSNLSKDTSIKYYRRNTVNSDVEGEPVQTKDANGNIITVVFTPSARNAQDGSIIDLTNEARAKATMIGAAAGGALGGFTGYQGAQSEISDRWVTAIREYNDSLTNFACASGDYFLAYYNGIAQIQPMRSDTTTENQ